MQKITYIKHPKLDDLINTDKETREFSRKILNNK
jgi:hypothetical protein